jgi:hypothetical protein
MTLLFHEPVHTPTSQPMDSTKSTAHCTENGHVQKFGEYFYVTSVVFLSAPVRGKLFKCMDLECVMLWYICLHANYASRPRRDKPDVIFINGHF